MDKKMLGTLAQLEQVLAESADRHEQLLGLMQQQRGALRSAEAERVTELSRQQNTVVQAISVLEKRRLALAASLTEAIAPDASEPLRLRDLAERLPEPARGRVLVLRQRLRERIGEVKEQSSVARRATESLMNHMQGLVQSLSHATAHGAGYDRPGRANQPLPAIGTFNLTA